MIEEWRAVVGFEGSYEVSNLGRVRSLDRMLPWKRTLRTGTVVDCLRRHAGKIMVPQAKEAGHMWVQLGRGVQVYVHHLVLEAFVGPAPTDAHVGLHWDDKPSNNNLGNLRWGTRADNAADFVRNYGHPMRRGKAA
jgi:hypothetical protein